MNDVKYARLVGEYSSYLSMLIQDYETLINTDSEISRSSAMNGIAVVMKVAKENLEKNGHFYR